MKKKPTILFVTHEASRGGAPILLLRLMQLLRVRGFRFNTLIMADGPLREEFEKISEVCIIFPGFEKNTMKNRFKRKIGVPDKSFLDILTNEVNVVFSNTIVNGFILKEIKQRFDIPIVTYMHELEMVCEHLAPPQAVEHSMHFSNHIFVPCNTVGNFLKTRYGYNEEMISILPYYIPSLKVEAEKVYAKHFSRADFTCGAAGAIDWRKGSDYFLSVIVSFRELFPEKKVQFVWAGAREGHIETFKFMHDLNKIDQDNVLIIPNMTDMESFYNSIDVLFLPSREDPYPLVVLEAASFKVPSICFDGGGGACEFISNGAGTVVPYLHINDAARAIERYESDCSLREKHGQEAYEKVKRNHQDDALVVNRFVEVIKTLIN